MHIKGRISCSGCMPWN